MISNVAVSEILTGSYLRKDYNSAVRKAEKVLDQFIWVSLGGDAAKLVAQLNAYLISKGLPIEYQDVAIAASCIVEKCDVLLELIRILVNPAHSAYRFCQPSSIWPAIYGFHALMKCDCRRRSRSRC